MKFAWRTIAVCTVGAALFGTLAIEPVHAAKAPNSVPKSSTKKTTPKRTTKKPTRPASNTASVNTPLTTGLSAPATSATSAPSQTTAAPITTPITSAVASTLPTAATTPATTTPVVATSAPATNASIGAPIATPPPTTTTTAAPAGAFDFNLRIANVVAKVGPGGTASYIVIVDQKAGTPTGVTMVALGLPAGAIGQMDLNPVLSAAELRLTMPSAIAPGYYEFQLVGSANQVVRRVTVGLTVESAPTSTAGATTTTVPSVTSPSRAGVRYAVAISTPTVALQTGGTVSYTITVSRNSDFTDTLSLFAIDLPKNVWHGFSVSQLPNGTNTATLWLSSTLPLTAGTYNFSLGISSSGVTQLLPLQVVIT